MEIAERGIGNLAVDAVSEGVEVQAVVIGEPLLADRLAEGTVDAADATALFDRFPDAVPCGNQPFEVLFEGCEYGHLVQGAELPFVEGFILPFQEEDRGEDFLDVLVDRELCRRRIAAG